MSLVERLREQTNKLDETKQDVINEIKAYFDEYFNDTKKLEQYVERISKSYIKERKVPVLTEFWEHQSGCSSTHFYCGGCSWYPKNDSDWYYKDIYLRDIQYEVCEYLRAVLKDQMIKLGFKFLYEDKPHSNLNYYKSYMWFTW